MSCPEMASTYAKLMIDTLLHVHALTNMHRSSDNNQYRKTAADWIPNLESQFESLKYELLKPEGQD